MKEYDAYEQAYKNGKAYMKQKILERLKFAEQHEMGVRRFIISDIIEMIENLEVKP